MTIDNYSLLHNGFGLFFDNDFLYSSDDIIDKTDLGHILCLKMSKFFGQLIGIHIPVARDEKL